MVQIYRFKNGDMYIGRLLDGKMTGIGSYIFSPENKENDVTSNNITAIILNSASLPPDVQGFFNGVFR